MPIRPKQKDVDKACVIFGAAIDATAGLDVASSAVACLMTAAAAVNQANIDIEEAVTMLRGCHALCALRTVKPNTADGDG